MHCSRVSGVMLRLDYSKVLVMKTCAQKPESACEKEDRLMPLYCQLSIHISVCLAFCEIDYGLFRNEACLPSLRS